MEITKKNIQVYQLRKFKESNIWADIYLDENKDGSGGALAIRSDYGSWDYCWGSCGRPLKEFICGIDAGYLMGKLSSRNEFDYDRWKVAAQEQIKYALQEKNIDDEKHDGLMQELEGLGREGFQSEDSLYVYLRETNSELFSFFGSSENFPNGKDYPTGLKLFIENIWKPFIQELKKEIEAGDETRKLLKTKIDELDISVRLLNCLRSADLETISDVISNDRPDFLKIRNFGHKCTRELDGILEERGLQYGSDVTKRGFTPKKIKLKWD